MSNMSANNSDNIETVNPLSDDFYRRYGLFELSTKDTFVFNPMVLYQDAIEKKESINIKKQAPRLSASDNAVFRGRRTTAPRASQNGSFKDKIASTTPIPTSEEATPPLPTPEEATFTKSSVILATFVRLLLIGHNILTVWRVTATYNDEMYWLLLISNVLLIAEGLFTICRRGGIDYKWWCPCFLIYLASTLPAIWLLQLKQYEIATGQSISGGSTTNSPDDVVTTPAATTTTTAISTTLDSFENFTTVDTGNATAAFVNYTTTTLNSFINFTTAASDNATNAFVNITSASLENATSATEGATTRFPGTTHDINTTLSMTTQTPSGQINAPNSEVWLIIVEESLIYLLVFSRWLLPRQDMSREFLADLLLEFLAIASDIMELLAVFDESQVRENLMLTYWVMAVWSASFIQFIPVLAQKRMFRHLRAPQRRLFTRFCGDSFVEIAYTCMSIFLQDGPFLVLRLFIMIQLKLITYSLVFFVLKNAVTVILLVYRLGIMCYRLPCCRGQKQKVDGSEMKNIGNNDNDLFRNSTESLDDKV